MLIRTTNEPKDGFMNGQFERHEQDPFASVTDEDEIFVPLAGHREALSELTHWLDSMRGIGMLTSGPGLGKSHVCRRLLALARPDTFGVLISHGHFRNVRELLQSVLYLCDRPFEGKDLHELNLELLGFIRELGRAGRKMLLVVDDAHDLTEELLLELRSLTVGQGEQAAAIRLLLSGQLELEETLARRSLSAINQNLTTHQILDPLTREESAEYLAGRLSGAHIEIETAISEPALELIVQASDGVPRCLNQLAEAAFHEAARRNLGHVTPECVRAAFERVRHLPQHWNDLPEPASDSLSEIREQDPHPEVPPMTAGSDIFETALIDQCLDDGDDELLETGHRRPQGAAPQNDAETGCSSLNAPEQSVQDRSEADDLTRDTSGIEELSEVEDSEVEYVVAEFGSGLEDSPATAIDLDSLRSEPHFASPKLSYGEPERNMGNVRKTTVVAEAKGQNRDRSDDSMLELVSIQAQNEVLQGSASKRSTSSAGETTASAQGKHGMTQNSSSNAVEPRPSNSRYVRSNANPIDIFAPDIPAVDDQPRSVPRRDEPPVGSESGESHHSIVEHVEQLKRQSLQNWESFEPPQGREYDVIEPESIPPVPKIRPTIELELPHLQSKPRYRNLFRNLRRNRGE
jgi:type II secretory pathway predicted ATPase ExeA